MIATDEEARKTMRHCILLLSQGDKMIKSCILAVLLASAICSQAQTTASNLSVVAYVYVSDTQGITALAAASDGKLTPVSGSPFPADVGSMAVNGRYLFGSDGVYIYSFSIASDGALTQVASINAQQFNCGDNGGPGALFLDHTGATLYDVDFDDCANNAYQSFSIDPSTGELSYLGVTSVMTPEFNVPLSFIGNNLFAYGASCFHFNSDLYGFQREQDETLTQLNINPNMPRSKPGDFFCPYMATADPANHLAVSVQAINSYTFDADGPPQLATYTADEYGNLTTKSTHFNMPAMEVDTYINDINMSPSGKLLAVGTAAGLQVFHFHGANPITHYTGLLTTDEIDQFFWDNDNHLYAISRTSGNLFVFKITPTSVSQAPGSPYTITNPINIIVLPKT